LPEHIFNSFQRHFHVLILKRASFGVLFHLAVMLGKMSNIHSSFLPSRS
jgi:hypothetical protein